MVSTIFLDFLKTLRIFEDFRKWLNFWKLYKTCKWLVLINVINVVLLKDQDKPETLLVVTPVDADLICPCVLHLCDMMMNLWYQKQMKIPVALPFKWQENTEEKANKFFCLFKSKMLSEKLMKVAIQRLPSWEGMWLYKIHLVTKIPLRWNSSLKAALILFQWIGVIALSIHTFSNFKLQFYKFPFKLIFWLSI